MQMPSIMKYRENIPHYLKQQNTEIPQYIKDDLLWIISSMMVYDTDEYDEVDIKAIALFSSLLKELYDTNI